MQLLILLVLLGTSLGFFTLAWFMNESKNGGYAMLTGFVLVMLAGLLTTGFGIEYKAGYTVVDTMNGSNIQYVFNTLTILEDIAVGIPLVIGGFWGTLTVALAMREQKREEVNE